MGQRGRQGGSACVASEFGRDAAGFPPAAGRIAIGIGILGCRDLVLGVEDGKRFGCRHFGHAQANGNDEVEVEVEVEVEGEDSTREDHEEIEFGWWMLKVGGDKTQSGCRQSTKGGNRGRWSGEVQVGGGLGRCTIKC